jgi:hypothetical protein
MELWLHSVFTLVLAGNEWSASRPAGKETPVPTEQENSREKRNKENTTNGNTKVLNLQYGYAWLIFAESSDVLAENCHGLILFLEANTGIRRLRYNRYLPNPFQFIHPTIYK